MKQQIGISAGIMRTFCEKCHDLVEYVTKSVPMEKRLKDKKIHFIGREAFCPKCKSWLFVRAIRDYNLKQIYAAYEAYAAKDETNETGGE